MPSLSPKQRDGKYFGQPVVHWKLLCCWGLVCRHGSDNDSVSDDSEWATAHRTVRVTPTVPGDDFGLQRRFNIDKARCTRNELARRIIDSPSVTLWLTARRRRWVTSVRSAVSLCGKEIRRVPSIPPRHPR